MPTRTAHACWEGSVKIGKGEIDFGNGLFRSDYSFGSRFETGAGTNPEELLGAAHASCFAAHGIAAAIFRAHSSSLNDGSSHTL